MTDDTVPTADVERQQMALVLYSLRQTGSRLVADCERMLDILPLDGRVAWRASLGEALVQGRLFLRAIEQAALEQPRSAATATHAIRSLEARLTQPRREIMAAMDRLLHLVPIEPVDELILAEARALRCTIADLPGSADARDDRERGNGPSAHPGGAPASARVLVVDDEAGVRGSLVRTMTAMGYAVEEAGNGTAALERIRAGAPDLVLTDINMPGLDGIALLQRIKGSDSMNHIPVIVISSQDDFVSVSRCIEFGAEDHIPKPFERKVLEARVRASLERKRLGDLERDHRRRVAVLTAAAEAVDAERYDSDLLREVARRDDALARLARVFDRMATGLQSRQERLRHRLGRLRREMSAVAPRSGIQVPSEDSPFMVGDTLQGRYQVLEQLGKGGMGMVYRAHDMDLKEEVALKVVRRAAVASDPAILERLKSEIRLTRRISHRNVVRAHDISEWRGVSFITMEYVRGITLEQLIDRRGRLGVDSTVAIGIQLAEALAVAHELQIIHRDIKPANLLITPEGVLKVMDFGIARSMGAEDKLTMGGIVVGTPQYMAPEQLRGRDVDARSDLFATGIVLYECLAGRPPYTADSLASLLASHAASDYRNLGDLRPDVPGSLNGLVQQLLRYRPGDRVASASELAARLADLESVVPGDVPMELIDLEPIVHALKTSGPGAETA